MPRYTCLLWICFIALHLFGVTEATYSGNVYADKEPTNDNSTVSPASSSTTQTTSSTTESPASSSTTQTTSSTTESPASSSTIATTSSTTESPASSSTTQMTSSTTESPASSSTTATTSSTTESPASSSTTATTSSTTESPASSSTTQTTSSTTESPASSSTTATTSSTPQTTTPVPFENDYDFVAKDEKGKACIAFTMTINLNVQYKTNKNTIATKQLPVPKEPETSGTCTTGGATMILTWSEVTLAEVDGTNKVIVTFVTKDSRASIDQITADIYLDETNFPDAAEETVQLRSKSGLGLFSTSTSNSIYACAPETKVGSFAFSSVKLLPVNAGTDPTKLTEENCVVEAGVDTGANTGAIIGGVIGGVVVVGIIGFVIWRRRKQSREQRSNLANTDKYL